MMLRASTVETGTRPREPLSRLFVLSVVTVAVLLAAAPVIVTSALRILGVESTTPIEWVPESFAPRRAYDQFTREFESGDVVVASWPGCEVGAPAIDRFIEQFKALAAGITAIAGGIVGISLLVGGIGIMNIMLVSVSERTREIGLRKAVGATPMAILLQFLLEAVTLCLVGGFIGIAVGRLAAFGLTKIPGAQLDQADIPLWAVALSFAFSAATGVVFGMFPAIKASRLDPIEALRHE